jgi:hypothetical protein
MRLIAAAVASASSSCSAPSSRPPLDFPPADGGRDGSPRRHDGAIGVDSPPEAATTPADVSPGTPALALLEVSPLALYPTFAPAIHDYYVRCQAGENSLTVQATAAPGASVAITRPTRSLAASSQDVTVTLQEDDAVVLTAAAGLQSVEYWVRCLPHDFPTLAASPHPAAGTPPAGYYLVGNTFLVAGESGYAAILDVNGAPVWYAKTRTGAGGKTVDLLDSNTVSFVAVSGYTFGVYEGSFEIHTLDPVGVQYVTTVGVPLDTHELRRLPNGDYLLFGSPIRTGVDLEGLASFGANEDMLDCVLQEVSPSGALVWQWTATDHFDPVKETTYPGTVGTKNAEGHTVVFLDAFHCNSIDWDANGDLLLSARNLDAIFLVSRSTGKVLWKIGGSVYNKDGARHLQVVGDPMHGFYRQHHSRFLPDGEISLFDDQTAKPGIARGLVLTYDVDAGTSSIAWQYVGKASTNGMGSLTILSDGSRVIGWGLPAGDNPSFTEVNEQGADLLDVIFTDHDSSYRALKVPASAVSLETLRTSIGPWSSQTGPHDAGADGAP